ncbi:MAG: SusC/RagA family TonB-linked outer membrane protein [Saprospiraceae bacterium]|nr:SusC/RagA family TonB-linked outer membrane protein [Saprospiraceae bacterium]
MKKFSLLILLLLGTLTIAVGQRTVTGNVSDSDGVPLIGANVLVAGSTVGTVTDLDGNFSIDVPSNINSLVVSYVGFTEKIVDITGQTSVNITLSEGQLLDEVVVTAAGVSRNARETVYANQTVNADDLMSVTNKNTLEALRGKTAGVRLSTGSGSVGASTRIVLRGEGSLTGDNNALIVVDGIPIDNSSTSGGAGSSTTGYADHGNRFNDINPDDIESVTILKGPSATSLYGSRGASGVVLIKTKKGNKGTSMRIDLNSSYSAEEAYVLLQRQDRFGQGYDNAHFDSGENWSWGPAFDGVVRPWTSPVDTDGDGAVEALTRPYSAVPNQLQEFFNRGNTATNSIGFSGGSNGFTYRASYSNVSQNGILENTYYKRNTVSLSAAAQLSEKLKSDFSISYANTNQNTAQEGSRAFEGNNAYAMAVQSPVNIPFGELRDYTNPFHGIDGYWGSYSSVNPYFILNEYGNEGKINNFLGNASLTYNLLPGLNLVGRFGSNVVTTEVETWTPTFQPAVQQVWTDDLALSSRETKHSSVGDYTNFFRQNTNLDFTAQAVYNKALNQDFSLDVTAGYNWFQRESRSITGETSGGLVVPGWYNLSNSTASARSSQFNTLYRLYGLLGNARLGYKNYAFLEYSARNDWSSTLPAANNSFFYNAFGASLVITDMLKLDSDVLNFAKFRTSYGTSGKDAGLYLLQSTYVGNPTIAALGDYAIFFPLNGQPGFTTGNRIGNPDLKPELTTTFEVGADVGLFNDRLNVAYTYYSADHSNQIVQISLPRSTGFTSTVANIGRMTNKGHELTVNVKPIVGLVKGLHWELFATYAKNVNNVEKITDDIDELVVGGPYTPGVSIVAKEGYPFGTFKALAEKTTPDGKVIVDGVTGYPLLTDEEQYLGSYIPDYTASFGTTINFKGLGFNMLFDMKKGGSFVSQTKFMTEFNGTALHTANYNREEYIYPNSVIDNGDGTFSENDIAITEQGFFTEYDPANSTFLIDASYLKLREMGVSYDIPKKVLSKASISSATLSVFARNVKFWLPAENTFADPEINGPALTGNASGIETTQTPPSRSIGVNLKLSF